MNLKNNKNYFNEFNKKRCSSIFRSPNIIDTNFIKKKSNNKLKSDLINSSNDKNTDITQRKS